MNRDIFIRNLTKDKIEMSPKGRNANELTPEELIKKSYMEREWICRCFHHLLSLRVNTPLPEWEKNGSAYI